MLCTLGQAKKTLARYASAYDLADLGAAINTACEELSKSRNWMELKRTLRLTANGQWFSLPQEYDTVLRAAVDSKPVSVRGSDYEFLHSGPGDLDYIPAGYAPAYDIKDEGTFATQYAMDAASTLAAFGTSAAITGSIKVIGKNSDGDIISANVPYNVWAGPADADTLVAGSVTATTEEFAEIERVILPDGLECYISLYGIADSELAFLSRMHPTVRIPEFRRYRMAGFSAVEGDTYKVLAEVRLRYMPRVTDDDVLPFDSLLPVQYMLQSMWAMSSDEVKKADDYRQRAELSIIRREDVKNERQGLLVLNTLYDDSPGYASENLYYNL